MQDFPANSQRAKATDAPREKLEPVTSAEAVRLKRGVGRQFKETFIGGSGRMAIDYMVSEVIVPAIRETLIDALQGGIERFFRGESAARPRRSVGSMGYSNVGHFNYQGVSQGPSQPAQRRMLSREARARHDLTGLVIPSRREAEEVLDRMFDLLSKYNSVTVADLYELTGIQSSHTDMKWGWTQLRGADVVGSPRKGGYRLKLPDPEPLG